MISPHQEKNNQSFYRSSTLPKDNSSESGDTILTSLSHPMEPPDCKSTGQGSPCEDKSDLESIAKSDFDRESICVRSDIDSTYAKSECSSIRRVSSSSCLQDEESNTTGSGIFIADSLMSDTNTSSSIPIRQDSNPSSTIDSSSTRTTRDSNNVSKESNTSKEVLESEVLEDTLVPMETNDTSSLDNSVPVFTSPFMRQAKSSKVQLNDMPNERSLLNSMSSDVRKVLEINGVPNNRRMLGDINNIPNEGKFPIGDIPCVYDEETRF